VLPGLKATLDWGLTELKGTLDRELTGLKGTLDWGLTELKGTLDRGCLD